MELCGAEGGFPFASRSHDQFECPIKSCMPMRERIAVQSQSTVKKPTLVNGIVLTQEENPVE
jgi:hypothetical protein